MPKLFPRSPRPSRLFTPLYTSFLFLLVLVLVQAGLSLLLEEQYQRAVQGVSHSLTVEREGARLLGAALDEQTSLRGYLLTGNRSFLEPYRFRAQTAFQESFDQLQVLVRDHPSQFHQLMQVRAIYDNWQRKFAQSVIAGTASKTTLPGKTLFDPMRQQLDALLRQEDQVLKQHSQHVAQFSQMKTILDSLSVLTILLGIVWNLWLLRQRVELPLHALTRVGQAWRQGQLDQRLNYAAPDEIGRLAQVLDAMAHDVRDRQERNQLRNQQLEDMISALSHDLRTPLLATRATLRPMLNGAFGPVSETWKEVLEEYYESNENLIKLVQTLLDVSRYEAGGSQNLSRDALDWQRIFTQVTAQARKGKPICDLVFHIAPELPTVYGDPLEIQRVVQNLLDNAVRVSEPNQRVVLDVTPLGTEYVKVSVCDRGPGIAPQERERLFHRFIQGRGRRGGSGLGLYLCRQIIAAHGGMINVDSEIGQGSTFWFTLPIQSYEPCYSKAI